MQGQGSIRSRDTCFPDAPTPGMKARRVPSGCTFRCRKGVKWYAIHNTSPASGKSTRTCLGFTLILICTSGAACSTQPCPAYPASRHSPSRRRILDYWLYYRLQQIPSLQAPVFTEDFLVKRLTDWRGNCIIYLFRLRQRNYESRIFFRMDCISARCSPWQAGAAFGKTEFCFATAVYPD